MVAHTAELKRLCALLLDFGNVVSRVTTYFYLLLHFTLLITQSFMNERRTLKLIVTMPGMLFMNVLFLPHVYFVKGLEDITFFVSFKQVRHL